MQGLSGTCSQKEQSIRGLQSGGYQKVTAINSLMHASSWM